MVGGNCSEEETFVQSLCSCCSLHLHVVPSLSLVTLHLSGPSYSSKFHSDITFSECRFCSPTEAELGSLFSAPATPYTSSGNTSHVQHDSPPLDSSSSGSQALLPFSFDVGHSAEWVPWWFTRESWGQWVNSDVSTSWPCSGVAGRRLQFVLGKPTQQGDVPFALQAKHALSQTGWSSQSTK